MQNVAYEDSESGAPSGSKSNQREEGTFNVEHSRFDTSILTCDGGDSDSGVATKNRDQCQNELELEKKQERQLPDKTPNEQHSEKAQTKHDSRAIIEAEKKKVNAPSHWHAFAAAAAGGLLFVGVGCTFGWTSSTEKFYVVQGSLDKATWGWIAGLAPFGAMFVPIPTGFLTDRFGRKPCLLGAGVLFLISWTLIGLATGAPMLLIGRFLSGVALGATTAVLPMYVNEISTDKLRPTLGALLQLFLTSGLLLSYSVGPYVDPFVLAAVSGAVPAIFLIVFFAMPESPYVLVDRGDVKEATKALAWLRGQTPSQVAKELASIEIIKNEMNAQRAPFVQETVAIFTKRWNRRAFLISLALMTFTQGTGMTPVSYFAQSIFRATGSTLDPAICTIILGAVKVVSSVGCVAFTKCFSPKTLLIISALGMASAHGVLGFYFYLKDGGGDVSHLGLLPLLGLLLFVVLYCSGFGPLPYSVSTELLAAGDARVTAQALSITYLLAMAAIVTSQFSTLLKILGAAGTFWAFSASCIAAAIFTIFFVPNTRHKSLHEIRHFLDRRSS